MREIYAGETYYGTSESKRSSTGALGEMQVLPSTFKDLVDRGVLGPKFASALGMSTQELKSISRSKKRTQDFLLNNKKGNYLAAMGKWINMKKAAK
jgi:soluble lytic murein transglycosylase-like protein